VEFFLSGVAILNNKRGVSVAATTDFSMWNPVVTNAGSTLTYQEPGVTMLPWRFYRARIP